MSIKTKISLIVLSLGFLLIPFTSMGNICTFSPTPGNNVTNDFISASGWDNIPSDTSDEIHINLTGDTIVNINVTTVFDNIYLDGTGVLNVVGSQQLTATSFYTDTNVVYNVDTTKLDLSKVYGYGCLVYDGFLPSSIGLKDWDNWHGTVWIKNYGSSSTAWALDDFGTNTSILKLTNIQGHLNYYNGTVNSTIELEGSGLTINNGSGGYKTTFTKLIGTGTLTISGGSSNGNGLLIKNISEFSGSINITVNKYLVTIGGNTVTSGNSGKILITQDTTVNIASGKQFSASGGIEINGTVNVSSATSLSGSITGTGTIVCDNVKPTLSFGGSSWTGLVWLKNIASGPLSLSNYGSSTSTVKVTNVGGYMSTNNETVSPTVHIDGTNGLDINNGNGGYKTTINKVIGTGTLTISGGSANGNGLLIKDISEFRGSINLSNPDRYTLTLGGDTCVSGASGKLCICTNSVIAAEKEWNCSILETQGSSLISGSGTLISYSTNPPTIPSNPFDDSWGGTFWLKNCYVLNDSLQNGFGLNPNIYGNTNSVLRLTNVKGYLTVPNISQTSDTRFTTPVELYDEGGNPGFTHNNGYGGYAMCFDKLLGSGTYVTSTAGLGERVYVKDYSEFTGKLNLSGKEMIFGGERPVYDSSENYNKDGNFNLNDSNSSMTLPASWILGGVIKTSGTLSITNSVSNEINISDTGTIYVNDWRLLSSATIKGSGRLLLENYNNRDVPVPTTDGFQINVSLRNESNWTGMFEFKNCYFGLILLNDWGNINSKVKFDNTASYIYPISAISVPNRISEFIVENTCTFDGTYSNYQEFKIDSKITGSGNIVVDIADGATAGYKTFFLANDVSEFTGNLYFGPNSQNIRICVGPTSRAFVDKSVVIGSDRNITLSNTQNWKTGVSSYIIDGILDTNSQSIPFYNINGSGTLKLSDPSYGNTNGFVNANWTGNVILKSHVATSGCPVALRYMGTSNSTIEVNNLTGSSHYLMPAGWKQRQEPIPALVKINGEVIFNNGSTECIHEFTKLTGDGDLKFTFANEITYEVDDLINYGGTIYCQTNNHVYLSNVYVTNAVVGARILKSTTTDEIKNIANIVVYENDNQVRATIKEESDGLYIANVAKITRDNIDYQFRSLHDAVNFSKENEIIYLMCNSSEDFHLPLLRTFNTNGYTYDGNIAGISLVITEEPSATIYEATLPLGLVVEIPQFSKTAKYNPPSYLDPLPVKYWIATANGSIENLNNWSPKHRLTSEDYGIINHGGSITTFKVSTAQQTTNQLVYAYNLYVGYPVKRKFYGNDDAPFETNNGWYFSHDGVPFYGAKYTNNDGITEIDNEFWIGAQYASGYDSEVVLSGNSIVTAGCLYMASNESIENSASKLTMQNNSKLILTNGFEIGKHPASKSIVNMYNNSVITSATDVVIGNTGTTHFNMNGNSTLNIDGDLYFSTGDGFTFFEMNDNSRVIADNIYMAFDGSNLCDVVQNSGTITANERIIMSFTNEECVASYTISNATLRAKGFVVGEGSASVSLGNNAELIPTATGIFMPDNLSVSISGDCTINVNYGITATINSQFDEYPTGNKLKKTGSGTLIFNELLPNTLTVALNDGILKLPSSSTITVTTDIDGANIDVTTDGEYKVYSFEYTEIEL